MQKNFKSFYDWCEENEHIDYIERWNIELNGCTSKDIPFQSNKEYYFDCLEHPEHNPELKRLDNIVHQKRSILCKQCLSFGQYLIDNDLFDLWDTHKNKHNPFKIAKQANIKIWMKCDKTDYHGSYEITCAHFSGGSRCPYCSRKSGKVHMKDSLGYKYPEVQSIWSDKNEKNCFSYAPFSQKKVWWKCQNNKHEDFFKQVYVMARDGFHCPKCSEEKKNSYLQEKVYTYFINKGFTVLTERNCNILPRSERNNRPLPYDNEIVELKLICEVHGLQHYWEKCSWYTHLAKRNGVTPEEEFQLRKEYDLFKEKYALEHGYNYLIIPYWTEKNNEYEKIIDNKIKEIIER